MEKVIRLLYVGDMLYVGLVDEDKLNSGNSFDIHKPLILTIKPIGNDNNQLEAVITDMVLPLEFAGIPVSAGLYSGFMNFAPSTIEIPSPNVQYVTNPNGERVAITRLATLVSKRSPIITVYDVVKSFIPSDELVDLYTRKISMYDDMMNATRMVDYQQVGNEQKSTKQNSPPENATGRVVDFKNTKM